VFEVLKMVMLKYIKREAPSSQKPSILSQQDIETAQKLIADAINMAAKNRSIVESTIPTQKSNVRRSGSMLQKMVLPMQQNTILQFGEFQ